MLLGIRDGPGLAVVLEGDVAVLEELLLPAGEEVGGDADLIAEVGDRRFLQEVPPGDLQDFWLHDGSPEVNGNGISILRVIYDKPYCSLVCLRSKVDKKSVKVTVILLEGKHVGVTMNHGRFIIQQLATLRIVSLDSASLWKCGGSTETRAEHF
jgi:hypothetical protein